MLSPAILSILSIASADEMLSHWWTYEGDFRSLLRREDRSSVNTFGTSPRADPRPAGAPKEARRGGT